MVNRQVRAYFINKNECPCPLTDELVGGGYRQKTGGYIQYAKECNIEHPTQYWHLIYSWSNRSKEDASFNKRIQCGELLFWMAEVSEAVDFDTLQALKDDILDNYLDNRRGGNKIIQNACYDKIVSIVNNRVFLED